MTVKLSQVIIPVQCTPGNLKQGTILSEVKACAGRVGKGGNETAQRLKGSLSHLNVEQKSVSFDPSEFI